MKPLQEDIEARLEQLRFVTHTDFAALALSEESDQIIRWRYAAGNRNERYKRIVLRPGKGIAGKIVRSARPFRIDSFAPKSGDDPREYPILLAEGLKSVLGVPVMNHDRVLGVLLIGNRFDSSFEDNTIHLMEAMAGDLSERLLLSAASIQNQTGEAEDHEAI